MEKEFVGLFAQRLYLQEYSNRNVIEWRLAMPKVRKKFLALADLIIKFFGCHFHLLNKEKTKITDGCCFWTKSEIFMNSEYRASKSFLSKTGAGDDCKQGTLYFTESTND